MALNFPDFGGDGGFDWKRFGYGGNDDDPTLAYHNQYAFDPYTTKVATRVNSGYRNFSYSHSLGSMTLNLSPSDFTYNGTASALKSRLKKGIYMLNGDVSISMPGNGLTSKAYTPSYIYDGYKYGIRVHLDMLHDEPYYFPSAITPDYVNMLGRNGFSESHYQFIAAKDNEIIPHPDIEMSFNSGPFMIDPEHIKDGLTGELTYRFARSLQEYSADATISANCELYLEWRLIYDMSDEVPHVFDRQFWKED